MIPTYYCVVLKYFLWIFSNYFHYRYILPTYMYKSKAFVGMVTQISIGTWQRKCINIILNGSPYL